MVQRGSSGGQKLLFEAACVNWPANGVSPFLSRPIAGPSPYLRRRLSIWTAFVRSTRGNLRWPSAAPAVASASPNLDALRKSGLKGASRGPRKKAWGNVKRWSQRYNWVVRASAWDREVDEFVRERQRDEIARMRVENAAIAKAYSGATERWALFEVQNRTANCPDLAVFHSCISEKCYFHGSSRDKPIGSQGSRAATARTACR